MKTFDRWIHSSRFAAGLAIALLMISKSRLHAQNLPPALMVEEDNRITALTISKVDVEVRIFGFLAETRMTLGFRNPLDRPLAGDLYFPLPVGATVSGYALDVDGAMVDGVVVDKDKGRRVFETETRKGVDPGLVEWTRGNHFKTRVFPIPARGTRTVSVSYVSEIVTDAQGNSFHLPLNFKEPVGEFQLRLEVIKAKGKPTAVAGAPLALQFEKWRESYVAEARSTNSSLTGELRVYFPEQQQQRVLVEKSSDGQYYFCINEFPVDPRPAPASPGSAAPRELTIFWDASGSRGAADHARELAWLKTWFTENSLPVLTVNLIPFRNSLAPVQRFTIKDGNASELLKAISSIAYDGGTQMGCLTNRLASPKSGVYFLFSDGLSTFGRSEPPVFDARLYVFTSDPTVDQPFLQYLAQRSGGAYFPLQRMTDQQILAALATAPFSFAGTDVSPATVTEVFPQMPEAVQGRFTLVGKLTAAEATAVIRYGAGGSDRLQSRHIVMRTEAVEGDLLRRFWAQKKLAQLLVCQQANEAAIAALGREYGLVTPYTSLIVLERVEQYVEHRIEPPASLPAARAEYARLVNEQSATAKDEARQKQEQVLALWQGRVEWWNKKFKYPANFKYREPKADKDVRRRPGMVTPLPSPAAPVLSFAPAESAAALNPDLANLEMAEPNQSGLGVEAETQATRGAGSGIALKEWDPDAPYLRKLKQAPSRSQFDVYLAQRTQYFNSPAFYLDCANFFFRQGQEDLAIQVLSNIAEIDLENAALLRVLAYRLLQIGRLDLACDLFAQVLQLRPEEPQSFRDLALALAKRGEHHNDSSACRRAMELLAKVVTTNWDRFEEIEVTALMELNALATDYARRFPREAVAFPVDERLRKLLDVDLRILLTWDADMTDIDVHITEPSGELAKYDHNLTTIGGMVSRDFTEGYGPEEYCLRKAMYGTYKIEANYYGSRSASLMGPVTVQAEVITNFGRVNEKRKNLTLRLQERNETFLVGEVEF